MQLSVPTTAVYIYAVISKRRETIPCRKMNDFTSFPYLQ